MQEITAKVAALVEKTMVAFNVGSTAGVREGNAVAVWRGMRLMDPDTKELLGDLRMRKLGLRVIHVQENLCVAEVTDSADSSSYTLGIVTTGWQRRKQVTSQPSEANENVVLVLIGDEATIYAGAVPDEQK